MELLDYVFAIIALLAGIAGHVLKKVIQLRNTDKTFSLKKYLISYPYKTALMVFVAAGAFLYLLDDGTLSLATAFMAGFSASSAGGTGDQ